MCFNDIKRKDSVTEPPSSPAKPFGPPTRPYDLRSRSLAVQKEHADPTKQPQKEHAEPTELPQKCLDCTELPQKGDALNPTIYEHQLQCLLQKRRKLSLVL